MRWTTCIGCRRTIPAGKGGWCADCPAGRTIRRQRSWTDLSRAVRSRGRCDLCGNPVPPERLEAHHLVPIASAPWRALDASNVVAACRPCHYAEKRAGP